MSKFSVFVPFHGQRDVVASHLANGTLFVSDESVSRDADESDVCAIAESFADASHHFERGLYVSQVDGAYPMEGTRTDDDENPQIGWEVVLYLSEIPVDWEIDAALDEIDEDDED
jgi:hypothetical protein